ILSHPVKNTLSLHDALPIFNEIEEKLLRLEKSLKEVKEQLDDLDLEIDSVRNDIPNVPDEFVDEACRTEVAILYDNQSKIATSEDRKSTRLNSSHVSISYAV